jgi:hypothetical protein
VIETEESWMSWVIDYATRVARPAWRIYHTRNSKGSHAGFPDLVLLRPPRLIFAELKTERGKLTRAQEDWLEALAMVGSMPGESYDRAWRVAVAPVEPYVWRPADRPDIERILS